MSDSLSIKLRVSARRRVDLDVALEVGPGITALCGPSGAGKTTLLLAIAGLFQPDSGRITLGERVLFDHEARIDLPPEARRAALVFQSLALFPHLTALDNAAYGLPRTLPSAIRKERARGWLQRMHVAPLADRKPGALSGGEAQRVALARALAMEPRVLLLDEPFSALDEDLRRELGDELRALIAELSIPALFVTHDRNEAARLAGQTLRLRAGSIEPQDRPTG